MTSLDEDLCLSLDQILRSFQSGISEEQCWSLCLQCVLTFKDHFRPQISRRLQTTDQLFLQSDGTVHPKSLTTGEVADNECQVMASLGVVLFHALDFGLREDEERTLSEPLEQLIDTLTAADSREDTREDETRDEGIFEGVTFDDIIHTCISRSTESHYRAVCRALVAETLELSSFLDQISRSQKPLEEESVDGWARTWINVIRELRNGVKLRKIDSNNSGSLPPLEYELTPFEMLLEDIRHKRYQLNPVGHLPKPPKKDAHELILDFIRSRPPLQSVHKRQLPPPPIRHVTLYEKLMQSIRTEKPNLRPTPERAETSRTRLMDTEPTPPPMRRRLIKADLNLRLSTSFDEEEEEEVVNTAEEDNNKFSLKNLSLRLLDTRRHSITVCESPSANLDVNEDTRSHVASIWEASEWGRALECLSLTLQEVKHIRSVLTKAEVETLAVTRELRTDLESGKICFTCLKTRFSFFGQWPRPCKVCERVICDRCATKMHIPCEHFEKVPIYMLSPTPSPPDPHHCSDWSEERESKSLPQMEVSAKKRSRLLKALTRDTDLVVVDSGLRKMGPEVRVCRDCKTLVRHLIGGSGRHVS